jgi:membrane carboxypeptidase/penicillin-binding protein
MVEAGYLRQEDAERLSRQPIQLHDAPKSDGFARYYKNYVTRLLVQQFGEDRVFDDGLRVYTTLDREAQLEAERAITEGLAKIEQQKGFAHPRYLPSPQREASTQSTPYLQAALVALEPATGHIRALVGGRDVDQSPFDRATQGKRQAGSAFKPFVYAAAIESGYTPATVLTDLDVTTDPSSKAWVPDEAHGSTTTSMTLQAALKTSSNRAAVRLLSQLGMGQAMTFVKRMGFDSIPAVPSMVLGTGEVSVLTMTTAYAAFANGGRVPSPVAIRRVESRSGDVLYQDRSIPQAAISEVTAFIMAQMLADVVNSGTGYRVRQEGFTWPAGGKTGTTDDFKDVWFAGFTPALAATVWLGFDQPQRIARNGFAGDLAAPIWGRFMKAAVQQRGAGRLPKPSAVVKAGLSTSPKPREGPWIPQPGGVTTAKICRITGLLASPGCSHVAVPDRDGFLTEKSMVTSVFFRRGTEPMDYCALHEDAALVEPDHPSTLPASLRNLNDLLRRTASGVIIR